jgi:hypothetical protein
MLAPAGQRPSRPEGYDRRSQAAVKWSSQVGCPVERGGVKQCEDHSYYIRYATYARVYVLLSSGLHSASQTANG